MQDDYGNQEEVHPRRLWYQLNDSDVEEEGAHGSYLPRLCHPLERQGELADADVLVLALSDALTLSA